MDIDPFIYEANNRPLDDFCGLSPAEMHRLIHEPFSKDSVVRLKEPIALGVLDRIPLFRLLEEFIGLFNEKTGSMKLTGTGSLQQSVLRELYSKGIIKDEYLDYRKKPITRENQWEAMYALHNVARLSGLVRMQHNKLFLTKKAKELMEVRAELFKYLLKAYAEQFNWGFMDGYPDEPVGQVAWPYTLYLLHKNGHEQKPTVFYSDLYKKAFPQLADCFTDTAYNTGDRYFSNCFTTRTFTRFLDRFGLIELDKGMFDRDGQVKAAPLLSELFEFE